jgi:hypothetical protein
LNFLVLALPRSTTERRKGAVPFFMVETGEGVTHELQFMPDASSGFIAGVLFNGNAILTIQPV